MLFINIIIEQFIWSTSFEVGLSAFSLKDPWICCIFSSCKTCAATCCIPYIFVLYLETLPIISMYSICLLGRICCSWASCHRDGNGSAWGAWAESRRRVGTAASAASQGGAARWTTDPSACNSHRWVIWRSLSTLLYINILWRFYALVIWVSFGGQKKSPINVMNNWTLRSCKVPRQLGES